MKSPADVRDLNRKQRNKMAVVKEGLQVHAGHGAGRRLHLRDRRTTPIAEPVIYMIDHFVVGGFYRVHTARGQDENLNAPGMQFRAARLRGHLSARPGGESGLRAQPLLRLRCSGASRPAGRIARAGTDGGNVRGQYGRASDGTQQPLRVAGA